MNHPSLNSQLLAPYLAANRLAMVFTHKPLPVGGLNAETGQPLTPEQAHAHRTHWAAQAGFTLSALGRWVVPLQTHGTQWVATSALQHLMPQQRHNALQGVDALIIDTLGDTALIQVADCVPLLLYDDVAHVAAIIHAGWRGTAAGVAPIVAKAMVSQFGCHFSRMAVVIGPAIGLHTYEVSPEVAEALLASLPAHLSAQAKEACRFISPTTGKPHVGLKQINAYQLHGLGIQHIESLPVTTCQQPSLFWSHRRGEGQRQGVLCQLK